MKKIVSILFNILFAVYKLFTGKSLLSYADYSSFFQRKVRYQRGCVLHNSRLGEFSYIGKNSTLINTTVGKFCSISSNCFIGIQSHPKHFVSTSPLFIKGKNIFHKHIAKLDFTNKDGFVTIGNDVWIGSSSMIKAGISIGSGAIVGAGSVVTKDVPPYTIVAGVPAKVIGYRFDNSIISKLLSLKWWDFPAHKLKKISQTFDNMELFLKNENNSNF